VNLPMESKRRGDLRDYLAAERTFLAWVRTGLALMGFGFVVARFGLFLQQLEALPSAQRFSSTGLSLWFGTALIAAGVIANLVSARRHVQLIRELDKGDDSFPRSLAQTLSPALFLAVVGIAMAIYLVSVRDSTSFHSGNYFQSSGEKPMGTRAGRGVVDKASNHSVDQIVEKLKNLLQARGITLFAFVDHSGEAEKVGMKMRPTKLLIFGSPKAGTPLMLAAPSTAIDLPLKILVWEDGQKKVWVSYNSPEYLRERHDLPQELLQNIAVVEALAAKAAE
jgi:uncharacterized protein (DUF302 family)/uncharacterized membrane protein YidH (DUF202 family)